MKVTRRQALKTIVSGSTGVLLTQNLGERSHVLAQAPKEQSKRKFRVGVQLQPQHTDWPTYADGVRRFDAMGVDSIWNWDHFFPLTGNPQGEHFEAWTMLGAMAILTKQAEIGCLVTCIHYRNPALLSNMAKTVDHMSGGRLVLGLGAGWFERDFTEYGYPFGTGGNRLRVLRTALPIIKERWQKDVPPPLRPIPVLIAGSGEKMMLKIVAQHATMWNGPLFASPEEWGRKNEILTEWCTKIRRDPNEIERTIWLDSPDRLSQLDAYAQAGATHLILGMHAPYPFEAVERLLAWRNTRNG